MKYLIFLQVQVVLFSNSKKSAHPMSNSFNPFVIPLFSFTSPPHLERTEWAKNLSFIPKIPFRTFE